MRRSGSSDRRTHHSPAAAMTASAASETSTTVVTIVAVVRSICAAGRPVTTTRSCVFTCASCGDADGAGACDACAWPSGAFSAPFCGEDGACEAPMR